LGDAWLSKLINKLICLSSDGWIEDRSGAIVIGVTKIIDLPFEYKTCGFDLTSRAAQINTVQTLGITRLQD